MTIPLARARFSALAGMAVFLFAWSAMANFNFLNCLSLVDPRLRPSTHQVRAEIIEEVQSINDLPHNERASEFEALAEEKDLSVNELLYLINSMSTNFRIGIGNLNLLEFGWPRHARSVDKILVHYLRRRSYALPADDVIAIASEATTGSLKDLMLGEFVRHRASHLRADEAVKVSKETYLLSARDKILTDYCSRRHPHLSIRDICEIAETAHSEFVSDSILQGTVSASKLASATTSEIINLASQASSNRVADELLLNFLDINVYRIGPTDTARLAEAARMSQTRDKIVLRYFDVHTNHMSVREVIQLARAASTPTKDEALLRYARWNASRSSDGDIVRVADAASSGTVRRMILATLEEQDVNSRGE